MNDQNRIFADFTFVVVLSFAFSYFFGYLNFANFLLQFSIYSSTFPLMGELNLSTEYFIFNGVRYFFYLLFPMCAVFLGYRKELWEENPSDFLTIFLPYLYWYLVLEILYLVVLWCTIMVPFPFATVMIASAILLLLMLTMIAVRHYLCQGSFYKFVMMFFFLSFGFTCYMTIYTGKYEADIFYRSILHSKPIKPVAIQLKENCPVQLGDNPVIFAQSSHVFYFVSKKQEQVVIDMVPREYIKSVSLIKRH